MNGVRKRVAVGTRRPATRPRLTPYRRVLLLSVALLALLGWVGALGVLGVTHMRDSFDSLVTNEQPRLDDLLHVDRDLFRAQLALEDALLAADPDQRADDLAEYRSQLQRTADRWDQYLTVAAGTPEELAWQEAYGQARAAYEESSELLARRIAAGEPATGPGVATLLASVRSDFAAMRSAVHDIEEEVAEPLIEDGTANVIGQADSTTSNLYMLVGFGLLAGLMVSFTTYRAALFQQRRSDRREEESRVEQDKAAFKAELNQALDLAQSEEAAISVVDLVLSAEVPDRPVELLLADSSHAHLAQMVTTDRVNGGPGCGVVEPKDCPAIRRGTTMQFPDSESYAACPHLRGRSGTACSGVCVPVSVAGRTVGVLHATGPEGETVSATTLHKLEEVADRAGDRVGVLRAFARSQTQAETDPLTGLLNRRSFEERVSRELRLGTAVAVAYGDLDHFKLLNDKHGHDAGDRALRLFARVLKDSVRDGDVVARWGGEEFVLALPASTTVDAVRILERVRANLALALTSGGAAPFTVSFGVADSTMSDDLETLVGMADDGLLAAKEAGRDRIVCAGVHDEDAPSEDVEVAG